MKQKYLYICTYFPLRGNDCSDQRKRWKVLNELPTTKKDIFNLAVEKFNFSFDYLLHVLVVSDTKVVASVKRDHRYKLRRS